MKLKFGETIKTIGKLKNYFKKIKVTVFNPLKPLLKIMPVKLKIILPVLKPEDKDWMSF